MKVQFVLRQSLLAGLIAALASAGGGCADDKSKTDLPGTPDVYQVMVVVNPNLADTLTDETSGYALTYGIQPDYDQCYLFSASRAVGAECTTDPFTHNTQCSELCADPRFHDNCKCGSTIDGVAMTCAGNDQGNFGGHCVDPATMKVPLAAHAVLAGQAIRIVVGELLDGATLEHFACGCQGNDLTKLPNEDGCADKTKAWSDDPYNCSACGASATGDESAPGRCVDIDSNGLPDWSSLIPGLATITCGSSVETGSPAIANCGPWMGGTSGTCTYTTGEGEGYYYASGNQFQSSVTGLAGMGPAIVINPAAPLPASDDVGTPVACTVAISNSVKTKTGVNVHFPVAPIWHTDVLSLAPNSPGDGEAVQFPEGNGTMVPVVIDANTLLDKASLANADITVENTNSSVTVQGTIAIAANKITVEGFPATFQLVDMDVYKVTVSSKLKDLFGQGNADAFSYTFSATKVAASSKK